MWYGKSLRALPVLAVALSVVACSEMQAPPEAVDRAEYGIGTLRRSESLVMRYLPATRESASATFDARGGELRAGGHILSVPHNAVSEPTVFTIDVVPGYHIHVDLTATRVSDGIEVARFNDGGEVKLRLSYEYGVVLNARDLRVGYLVDGSTNGRKEVLGSTVDVNGKYVDAKLRHFSQYALLID